jgi:hypothetical protein
VVVVVEVDVDVEVEVEVVDVTVTVVVVDADDEFADASGSSLCCPSCSPGIGSTSVARTVASCFMRSSTRAWISRAASPDPSKSRSAL